MSAGTVLILGVDDVATACALRLFRSGFSIIMGYHPDIKDLHGLRNFSDAVMAGSREIDGVQAVGLARVCQDIPELDPANVLDTCKYILTDKKIPLLDRTELERCHILVDFILIADERMLSETIQNRYEEKEWITFSSELLKQVKGYLVCRDKNRLGRVMYPFLEMEAFTEVDETEKDAEFRIIRAPIEGVLVGAKRINDSVHLKEEIAKIADIPILSPVKGRVTGMIRSGLILKSGEIFCEIDETARTDGKVLPAKAWALAGGVLEAVLFANNLRGRG